MRFSLRAIMILMVLFALLAVQSPVLAVFASSFLPMLLFIAYQRKVSNAAVKMLLLGRALFPVYLASYGPSMLINSYVLWTNPPSTPSEVTDYNNWVKFQARFFTPMSFIPSNPGPLTMWKFEYTTAWMELSERTMEYFLSGPSENTGR